MASIPTTTTTALSTATTTVTATATATTNAKYVRCYADASLKSLYTLDIFAHHIAIKR